MFKVKISKTNTPPHFLTLDEIKKIPGIYEVAEGSLDRDALLIVANNNDVFIVRESIDGCPLWLARPNAGWESYKYIKSNRTATFSN